MIAAIRPGAWMKGLEATNIAMAFVVIAVLLALFTPVADPRRLSVGDQVARLERGKVKAADFDYVALRFDDGRYGRQALDVLQRHADPVIRKKAIDTAKLKSRPYMTRLTAAPSSYSATRVFPKGQVLPGSFVDQAWSVEDMPYCSDGERNCRALLIDTDGDGAAEVLLSGGGAFEIFKVDAAGVWKKVAQASSECVGIDEKALEAGDVRIAPSALAQDLVIGGKRMRIEPTPTCDLAAALSSTLARKKP